MSYIIRKTAEQLQNQYYPIGQKGPEMGGNADQESEVSEEINDEMEAQEMEGHTPGNDNLVINKNDNVGDKFAYVLAELKNLVILTKAGYARDLIKATIINLEKSNCVE